MQKYKNFSMCDAFDLAYTELGMYEPSRFRPFSTLLQKLGEALQKLGTSMQQAPSN